MLQILVLEVVALYVIALEVAMLVKLDFSTARRCEAGHPDKTLRQLEIFIF